MANQINKHCSFHKNPISQIQIEPIGINHQRRKSKLLLFRGKHINKRELELYQYDLNKLCEKVYRKIEPKEQVDEFKKKYECLLDKGDGYLDMVLIINNFSTFQLFDHVMINPFFIDLNSKIACVCLRNNIFLKILAIWQLNTSLLNKDNEVIFNSKGCFEAQVESFERILEVEGYVSGITYEVELLLLSSMEFKKTAHFLLNLSKDYFIEFSNNCNITINLSLLYDEMTGKKSYESLEINYMIFIRKSINILIQRKLYPCLENLFNDLYYCLVGSEGRIWCSIINAFSHEQIISLWNKFRIKIPYIKSYDSKHTLSIEYNSRLEWLKQKIIEEDVDLFKAIAQNNIFDEFHNKTNYVFTLEKMELQMHLGLGVINNIINLIEIMFKTDKKCLIIDFIPCLKQENSNMRKQIFERSLENDEEISIELLQIVPEEELIEEIYIKMALLKKYFRLCCYLVKYPNCKNYLHSPPPKNEYYYFLMQKNHFAQKQKKYNQYTIKNLLLLNNNKQSVDDNISEENEEASKDNDFGENNNSESRKPYMTNLPMKPEEVMIKELRLLDQEMSRIEIENQRNSNSLSLSSCNYSSSNMSDSNPQISTTNANLIQESGVHNIKNLLPKPKAKSTRRVIKYKTNTNDEMNKRKSELGKINDVKEKKYDINVQMILIDQIPFGEYTYYSLCLFNLIIDRFLIPEYIEKLCKNLMVLTRDDHEIIKIQKPLLTLVLACEFLEKLGKLFPKNQYKCSSVCDHLLRLAFCFQSAIKEEGMLKYYFVQQKDIQNRNALEIIANNRFNLLLNKKVDDLINNTNWDISMFKFFRGMRIFSIKLNEESYNETISNNLFSENTLFSFQFRSYINNPSVKTLHNNIVSIIFAFISGCILGSLLKNKDKHIFPIELSFSITFGLTFIFNMSILIEHILFFIFLYKTKRFLHINYNALNIDLLIIIMSFSAFAFIVDDNHYLNQKINFKEIIFFSVLLVLMSLRALQKFGMTKIGNIIRVISDLKWNIFGFLCFFTGFTTLSSTIYFILFSKTNKDFESFYSSWLFMFNATFGQYDYNFTKLDILGSVLLMINITMVNIGLFNLIVAIITNLFDKFSKRKDSEYRLILIQMNQLQQWNDKYGMLIVMPPPYNLITFIFMPFLLLIKDENLKQKMNIFSAKVAFAAVLLVNYIFFSIIYIILFPFAYIQIIFVTFKELIKHKIDTSTQSFFFILIKRFGDYFILFGKDSYIYWTKSFDDVKTEKKTIPLENTLPKHIIALRELLTSIKYKQHRRLITLEELKRKIMNNKLKQNIRRSSIHIFQTEEQAYKAGSIITTSSLGGPKENSPNSFKLIKNKMQTLIQKPSKTISTTFKFDLFKKNDNKDLMWLIDKITNEDMVINVDQALSVLTLREKHSGSYLERIKFYNIRVFEQAMKHFYFYNHSHNAIYTYTRLQNIIFKILIKFKLIYCSLPVGLLEVIKPKLEELNYYEDFSKKVYKKNNSIQGNFSDFDDENNEEDELFTKIPSLECVYSTSSKNNDSSEIK